jgi:uncharacterized protein
MINRNRNTFLPDKQLNNTFYVYTEKDKQKSYQCESLIQTKYDYWYCIDNQLFLIPYRDKTIAYIIRKNYRDIHLIDAKAEHILKNKQIPFLYQNNPDECIEEINEMETNTVSNTVNLMLSLSTDCNLKCTYCYINGGESHETMKTETITKYIDHSVKKCLELSCKEFNLHFHGQGEPTLHWNLFCYAVEYYYEQCRKNNLTPKITLMTNGVLTETKLRYIIEKKIDIGISMDTYGKTLDTLRPMRSGDSLSNILNFTLKYLNDRNYRFGIRSTITELNVAEMSDFIVFLSQYKSCAGVKFEPITRKGRAANDKVTKRFIHDFIRCFIDARIVGYLCKLQVDYSPSELFQKKNTFCTALGNGLNMCVNAQGFVTSCYEYMDNNNDSVFSYGELVENKVVIDNDKLRSLVTQKPRYNECYSCFLSPTCCGDCHSRRFQYNHADNQRCFINREIARNQLFMLSILGLAKQEIKES